ncbi:hypothetical protein SPF06_16510 [Sinomonas sp. JGH33]|uniref:RNA polymerase sigma factor 70 region 4 type 2 domain-containing protein n=1 Tax=Sinomonas terricola TaxID=3110330 RepID=A0ABU5T9L8_9MICC|nr:hypothetical protein [Sinomonas sp. JGH33]MEA5456340.1 hypothetical protein [Sinomonas sp. JGH33]
MCELPRRHLRNVFKPARLAVGVLGVALASTAWLIPGLASTLPIGAGALVLLGAVLPALRDWELQLPGFKVSGSLDDHRDDIYDVFEHQRGDLQLCAQMLCGEPDEAKTLLEAALAQTAEAWRGPVTPQLRLYTLCLFVKLAEAHEKWATPPKARRARSPLDPLHALPFPERVAVVLHDFGRLTIAEIAGLTDSTTPLVTEQLGTASQRVASLERGRP